MRGVRGVAKPAAYPVGVPPRAYVRTIPDAVNEQARTLYLMGLTKSDIARKLGISRSAVGRAVDPARRMRELERCRQRRRDPRPYLRDTTRFPIAQWQPILKRILLAEYGWPEDRGSITRMAADIDLPNELICGWLYKTEYKTVAFSHADQVLAKLGLVHLWYAPPPEGLSNVYAELAPPEREGA
jgi:hypothetical protein